MRSGYFALGVVAGALVVGERAARRKAERFAAAAMETLLRAVDANDPQTGEHVRRVAEYSLILADAIGVDADERRTIELTALFHDIGKIHEALFDIVHDDGRLDPAERRAVATHPARGAAVLAPIAHFHPRLARAVLAHHERWDGRGYPRGIRGRAIPFAARIVTIADTYDAVTYGRRYRAGRAAEAAEAIIVAGRAQQFDPHIVDLFMLPPVLARFRRAHRAASTRAPARPRAGGEVSENAPPIEIRWRTRTSLPSDIGAGVSRPAVTL